MDQSTYNSILAILTRRDPIGIILANNFDEYTPEAKSISARLNHVHSEQEIAEIVYEEFLKWFDKETIGHREKYDSIAKEIYVLLSRD